jgi:hypothetical protein
VWAIAIGTLVGEQSRPGAAGRQSRARSSAADETFQERSSIGVPLRFIAFHSGGLVEADSLHYEKELSSWQY